MKYKRSTTYAVVLFLYNGYFVFLFLYKMKEHHIVGKNLAETIAWLIQHDECFDELVYNSFRQELTVKHAAGEDVIREGMFLTAKYGLLVTS